MFICLWSAFSNLIFEKLSDFLANHTIPELRKAIEEARKRSRWHNFLTCTLRLQLAVCWAQIHQRFYILDANWSRLKIYVKPKLQGRLSEQWARWEQGVLLGHELTGGSLGSELPPSQQSPACHEQQK